MFYIPERIRFLKTHHNGDATLEQDALLTSKTNIQWQKIFDDLLICVYNNYQRKNPDVNFQKDVIDIFHDHDAVNQRIASINYYLSDYLFKNDFDYCHIKRCWEFSSFEDFYLIVQINGSVFSLYKGDENTIGFFILKL
ncbi:hypothetical protein [Bartonella sp. WD16.2]|uniref:hypothetical protein n=1 Tax=Bartonella sp. WD16.2 TaxID=1933904 RepID=UPI0009C2A654|nr:hypothetical protein [Bartonella sp. WD16.2]AQX19254.1 hypothetical protein BWD162_001140 [Bartonella sp. WD16.2]AQX20178.1 hypothetical protein BWD162_010780 [Bartonella sp. WD16.2]